MRNIVLAVVLVMAGASLATAAVLTSEFGDKSATYDKYRMEVDSDGVIYTPPDSALKFGVLAKSAKRVVCVDASGLLYASATTVDCN